MDKQNLTTTAALVLAVFALGMTWSNQDKELKLDMADQQQTISVSGEAERLVAPDTAKITFSMTRKDTELSRATDSVNQRVGEMVQAFREFGITESDVQTTTYQVYPEYNYKRESGERSFDGYRVRQSLELVIRDLDQVSAIVTKIATFEVDNVSGLSFYVDQDQAIRQELRNEAISDAKAKARELARSLGVHLDTIVGFYEQDAHHQTPLYSRSLGFTEVDFSAAEAVVPAGENTYQSRVTIEFAIN